jgi:hypothetical protein
LTKIRGGVLFDSIINLKSMPTYEGEERRSEPRDGEISEEQARKALERALKAPFTEGDAMRERIRGLFLPNPAPKIDIPKTPLDAEAREYVEALVSGGYGLSFNELTNGGLYNPDQEGIIKAPTIEEAIEILQAQLSMEEMEAIRQHMGKPGFIMEPQNLPWRRFVLNLDTGENPKRATDTCSAATELDRQDQVLGIQKDSVITGWKIGAVDREKKIKPKGWRLEQILAGWELDETASPLQLLTPKLYALVQKGALLSGNKKLLDGKSILQRADTPQEGESSVITPKNNVLTGENLKLRAMGSNVRLDTHPLRGQEEYGHLRFALMKNVA